MRVLTCAALVSTILTQAAPQTFEVASIKPYKDNATGGPIIVGGNCRGVDQPAPGSGATGSFTQTTVSVGGPPPGAALGAGGGAGTPFRLNAPSTPVGRCVFTRMTLKQLINA